VAKYRGFRLGWENSLNIPCTAEEVTDRPPRSFGGSGFLQICSYEETRKVAVVAAVSSGWFATYEVFSLGATRSRSLSLSTLPLGETDIKTHLERNLRYTPVCSWKCEFPLTISPDLNYCSILDKIYYLSRTRTSPREVSLPLLSLITSSQAEREPGSGRKGGCCYYRYQPLWSPDSRWFAVLVDGISSISIAVFSPRDAAGTAVPFLINSLTGPASWSWDVCDPQFHPREPLLLFRVHEDAYLWPFESHPSWSLQFFLEALYM